MSVSIEPALYRDGEVPLEGVLARDHQASAPAGGLLLVHGGAGLDAHARTQAARYAQLGYAVLACDMFGPGVAGDRARVMGAIQALRDDRSRLRGRAEAGLKALAGVPGVAGRLSVIGFCFGGLVALELARAGLELAGAVSVHGSLQTARPAQAGAVQARVLACHGARDPHVPVAHVAAFVEEMNAAGADWQLNVYGGAMHGFTHADAPKTVPGVAFHAAADARSFADVRGFLAELHPNRDGAPAAPARPG